MREEIFADGIKGVAFAGGAVRLQLGSYRPSTTDPNAKPVLEETACIIMTPEGLIALYNGVQEIMGQFEKVGIIKKQPVGQA